MIPILYPDEVAAADRDLVSRTGIPDIVLMENAAVSLCDAILSAWPEDRIAMTPSVAILCGPGNNGADGMALGRHLAGQGFRVRLLLCSSEEKLNDLARQQLSVCREIPGIYVEAVDDVGLPESFGEDIIVDAMLGTGATGPLRPPYDELCATASSCGLLRVAVDIPTGIDGRDGKAYGSFFRADLTVTMGAVKPGLLFNEGADASGEVLLSNLSVPVSFYARNRWILDSQVASSGLPQLHRRDHKYHRGSVLIVAGSRRMTGAGALVASGVLHAGAGLITMAIPEEAFEGARSITPPEIMLLPLPSRNGCFIEDGLDLLRDEMEKIDVIVTGPGVGTNDKTMAFLEGLVSLNGIPVVIDADGLHRSIVEKAVARRSRSGQVIVTPHHGEMARLMDLSPDDVARRPLEIAAEAVETLGADVVLKGAPTVVASSDWALVNGVGNRGMATGGTGDVLAGVIAGVLSGSGDATTSERVATAVWSHSRGADIALEEGVSLDGLTATTISRYVSRALSELRDSEEEVEV